jgi:hypothetical protein
MTSHDDVKRVAGRLQTDREFIEKLAPELGDLSLDMQEIRENSKDPLFLSLLMLRVIKEREKTNTVLEGINEKYDKIMFEMKTKGVSQETVLDSKGNYEVLPEQDRVILDFADKNQGATATQIKEVLSYKGLNAASQRLNKLHKDGHLKKIQSGRNVLYLIR